jgi:hypothetical protein
MVSSRLVFALVSVPLFAAAMVIACGDDTESKTVPTVEGGTSSSGGSSGGSSGTSSSGGTDEDGGQDSGCAIVESPQAPNLDGGNPCGALDFGDAAVPFGDASSPGVVFDASTIPPGIYDTVHVETPLMTPGSWRETFVVGADGKFTRIRQISSDVEYRSGTIASDGPGNWRLVTQCLDGDAGTGDGGIVKGDVRTECGTTYWSYGLGNTRATLKRR